MSAEYISKCVKREAKHPQAHKLSKAWERAPINCKVYALRSDILTNWIVFCAVSAIFKTFVKIKLLHKLLNFIDINLCKKVLHRLYVIKK